MLTLYIGSRKRRGLPAVGRKELCAVCLTAVRASPVRMTLDSMFVPTSPDKTPDWFNPHWNNTYITLTTPHQY